MQNGFNKYWSISKLGNLLYQICYPSICCWTLRLFPVFNTINKTAMSFVYNSLWKYVFLFLINTLRVECGHMRKILLNFLRNYKLFPKRNQHLWEGPQSYIKIPKLRYIPAGPRSFLKCYSSGYEGTLVVLLTRVSYDQW